MTVQKLLRRFAREQPLLLLLAVVCSFGSAYFGVVPAFIGGQIVDAIRRGEFSQTTHLALMLLASTTLFGALHATENLLATWAAERFGRDLRAFGSASTTI